jgi:ATP-dependent Clp protease, protease subunit
MVVRHRWLVTNERPVPGHTVDEDIYRRLFERRTLLFGEPLEDWNSNRLCNGLILLSAEDPHADIRLLINSIGGSVPGMLAIRDCMRAIPNDVVTVNLGMAYSAGQFLLSAGTRGKRYTLQHAKVLLHQGSAGIGGTAMDIAIPSSRLSTTRAATAGSPRPRRSTTGSSITFSNRPGTCSHPSATRSAWERRDDKLRDPLRHDPERRRRAHG